MAQIEVTSVAEGTSGPSFEIFIDGQARGCVEPGETCAFPVIPGVHTVRLRTARNAPEPVKIVVSGTTTLLCRTTVRRLFGVFAAGEPETRIVVREREDVPAFVWHGREEILQRGGDLLAVGD